MPAFRFLAALAMGLFVALFGTVASAQSIIVPASFERAQADRLDDGESRTWMNYDDCLRDDKFSWNVTLSNYSGTVLEVWVGEGSDCNDSEKRSNGECWRVYTNSNPDSDGTETVTIAVRDVVARKGVGNGTLADCDTDYFPIAGQTVTLYFMLIDGTSVKTTSFPTGTTKVDLEGPLAPGSVSAGAGENRLVVSWDPSDANDLSGYRIYCDPPPGAAASSPASQPMGGSAIDSGTDGAAGAGGASALDGGTDGSADSGSGGSAGASGSAGSSSGGTTGTGNPACPSALVSGARPEAKYQCATIESAFASSGEARKLINGTGYAIAVAAVDKAGNSGPLSSVACGTPQEVDDFFELYRRAGGKGGGGYCSVSRFDNFSLLGLLGVSALAWVFRRRSGR